MLASPPGSLNFPKAFTAARKCNGYYSLLISTKTVLNGILQAPKEPLAFRTVARTFVIPVVSAEVESTQLVSILLGFVLAICGRTAFCPETEVSSTISVDGWARVIEDDRSIKIETDKLEAVIPKNRPKHWITGIESGPFWIRRPASRK